MRWLPLILALTACKANAIAEETDVESDTDTDADTDADTDSDTDADTDSDTDADTDSDTDSDTDTDTGPPPDVVFDFDGDWADATLTLNWLNPGSDDWDPSDPRYGHGVVDADSYGIFAGTPPAAELWEPEPTDYPGLEIAMYIPALHEDYDADGLQSGGEPYVGVGGTWVIYAQGTIPDDLADLGLVAGWNAMFLDFETGYSTFGDPLDVPFDVNLRPVNALTIGGTYVEDIGENERIALIPMVMFEGTFISSLLYDDVATDPWEITVTGDPPSDHLAPLDGWGGQDGAIEVPIAYLDADGSGGPSEGDAATYGVCYGGDAVLLPWMPQPTDLQVAWQLTFTGWVPGWNVLASPADGSEGYAVPADDLDALEISTACSIGG